MTNVPLINQIQNLVLDDGQPVTRALRLAKIAAAKLDLDEFQVWVDCELDGYDCAPRDLPDYRHLNGLPKGRVQGRWILIRLENSEIQNLISEVYLNERISAIEDIVLRADGTNQIYILDDFRSKALDEIVPNVAQFGVELSPGAFSGVTSEVRNILLKWTIEMEKAGIRGENLMFTPEERKKSELPTAQIINNNHIAGNVGSLMQGDVDGNVIGNTGSFHMGDITDLVEQIEGVVPSLPETIRADVAGALTELKVEMAGEKRPSLILESLKKIGGFAGKVSTNIAAAGLAAVIRTHLGL
ncbi:MAG: hypothetical protein NVV72_00970 [Asticcacaulis sp.]|nr:hypothetical protein [Asticcacaulis sp.]